MSLYYINTEELIIKPANSHKLWVNYWVKKVDLKLKKISRISVQSVRKYFHRGSNRFAPPKFGIPNLRILLSVIIACLG